MAKRLETTTEREFLTLTSPSAPAETICIPLVTKAMLRTEASWASIDLMHEKSDKVHSFRLPSALEVAVEGNNPNNSGKK